MRASASAAARPGASGGQSNKASSTEVVAAEGHFSADSASSWRTGCVKPPSDTGSSAASKIAPGTDARVPGRAGSMRCSCTKARPLATGITATSASTSRRLAAAWAASKAPSRSPTNARRSQPDNTSACAAAASKAASASAIAAVPVAADESPVSGHSKRRLPRPRPASWIASARRPPYPATSSSPHELASTTASDNAGAAPMRDAAAGACHHATQVWPAAVNSSACGAGVAVPGAIRPGWPAPARHGARPRGTRRCAQAPRDRTPTLAPTRGARRVSERRRRRRDAWLPKVSKDFSGRRRALLSGTLARGRDSGRKTLRIAR